MQYNLGEKYRFFILFPVLLNIQACLK